MSLYVVLLPIHSIRPEIEILLYYYEIIRYSNYII